MKVDPRDRQTLEFAAMLHDVGKIAIPKEILNKPAKLTDEEFAVMKKHTIEGQYMLDRVGGLLGSVGEIVRSCHERWDGKGYPDGLKGEEIPLAARIVFTCDAYNAMTTDRVYRPALAREEALLELTHERRHPVRPERRRRRSSASSSAGSPTSPTPPTTSEPCSPRAPSAPRSARRPSSTGAVGPQVGATA